VKIKKNKKIVKRSEKATAARRPRKLALVQTVEPTGKSIGEQVVLPLGRAGLGVERLVASEQPTSGHPIFHDLERKEICKRTAERKDEDVIALREALMDADARIGEAHALTQSVMAVLNDCVEKDSDAVVQNSAGIPAAVQEQIDRLTKERDDLLLAAALQPIPADANLAKVTGERDQARAQVETLSKERESALGSARVANEHNEDTQKSLKALKAGTDAPKLQRNIDKLVADIDMLLADSKATNLRLDDMREKLEATVEYESAAFGFAILNTWDLLDDALVARVEDADQRMIVVGALAALRSTATAAG